MKTSLRALALVCACLGVSLAASPAGASSAPCARATILVHDAGASGSGFDATAAGLAERYYNDYYVLRPQWGSRYCLLCNDHQGAEQTPVREALEEALRRSCHRSIDVVAHGMGVTLAAREILELGIAARVRRFIAIGGALRGINACGRYPFHSPSPYCGAQGLSLDSPFLDWLRGQRFAEQVHSLKSYADARVCAGSCLVDGVHTSSVWGEAGSDTFNHLGHDGLLRYTSERQLELLH